jgi:hypothetical protein
MILILAGAAGVPAAADPCQSKDARDIVVCAERGRPYQLDPTVLEAAEKAESNARNATTSVPLAQAVCASAPSGCGTGLESLDLANVAFVVGTAAFRAAQGKDWTAAFRHGGPGEYQLYLQAKQRREAQELDRAAARVKSRAQEAERSNAAKTGAE